MELIKAQHNDFNKIKDFYNTIIDEMQGLDYAPKWKKDIYPYDELFINAINNQELYMIINNNECIAAMILNQDSDDAYDNVLWNVKANKNEVKLIHLLGVLYKYKGQGIAKFMVNEAINIARRKNYKAIRLDVLEGNTPAMNLYTSIGFKYVSAIEMFYEDTGVANFLLYEYIL